MRAAGRLQHPRIVRAFDAERAGDVLLLVLEYVEGVTLERLVAKKGAVPVSYGCRWVVEAAEGLQHAHEQGLVHRDIKPANLMLTTKTKEVKILDFGLARISMDQGGGQTKYQTFMGTPEYVAPEQANDARSADIRADIYSLGCTLYHLLAGKPPFGGGSVVQKPPKATRSSGGLHFGNEARKAAGMLGRFRGSRTSIPNSATRPAAYNACTYLFAARSVALASMRRPACRMGLAS
jgi:serine/threonine protein kinase